MAMAIRAEPACSSILPWGSVPWAHFRSLSHPLIAINVAWDAILRGGGSNTLKRMVQTQYVSHLVNCCIEWLCKTTGCGSYVLYVHVIELRRIGSKCEAIGSTRFDYLNAMIGHKEWDKTNFENTVQVDSSLTARPVYLQISE